MNWDAIDAIGELTGAQSCQVQFRRLRIIDHFVHPVIIIFPEPPLRYMIHLSIQFRAIGCET